MLHFPWFEYNAESSHRVRVSQYRFCRLMFGLNPRLASLNIVVQHHLTQCLLKEPDMVRLVTEGFYVDDFVSGALTAEEGRSIY